MTGKKRLYFRNLDAVRSIACLFVLLSHMFWEPLIDARHLSDEYTGYHFLNQFLNFFFKNGGFGVRLFFVLSGFLITTLIVNEIEETGKFSLKNFYLRRILRIWPVYYAVILFCFIVYPVIKQQLTGEIAVIYESRWQSFLFLTNFDAIAIAKNVAVYPNGMLAVTWSVSVEEQFYLVWPLLFYFLPPRWYKKAILLLILLSVVFIFFHHADTVTLYYHTAANVLYLGTGALLALLLQDRKSRFLVQCLNNEMAVKILMISFFSLAVWGVNFIAAAWYEFYYALIVAVAIFLLLLHQVAFTSSRVQLGGIKILVTLSSLTYGLYMYHRIVYWGMSKLTETLFGINQHTATITLFSLLALILSVAVSWFSYRYFEKYFLQLKERFSLFTK